MGFWQDLGDGISGKKKQEFAAAQMEAQMEVISAQAAAEAAAIEAKTSPEALKARTRQITVVVSVIGGLLLLYMMGKIFKWF